jgi:hypothetical protein
MIARRLGGSSTWLPDIVAANNKDAILLSIEAKSGSGMLCMFIQLKYSDVYTH